MYFDFDFLKTEITTGCFLSISFLLKDLHSSISVLVVLANLVYLIIKIINAKKKND